MALLANSYGDPDEIAKLVPRYASAGQVFDDQTRPPLETVESMCDQVSAVLNNTLAKHGIEIPITQADAVLMMDFFVNQEVASMVEGVNGSGRFGPTNRTTTASRWQLVLLDAAEYIENNIAGLMGLGVEQGEQQNVQSIGYRNLDNSGDDVPPMFQREGFGNDYKDWDT